MYDAHSELAVSGVAGGGGWWWGVGVLKHPPFALDIIYWFSNTLQLAKLMMIVYST